MPGFAFGRCASFKLFWPPALAGRAPLAIILQALRRFRGAVLFRSLRPSSSWAFPFWLLGLTVQSSRPAFGGRLTFVRYIKGVAMWGSIFGALVEGIGGAAELRKEEEQKQRAFEKAMEDYSLNCRRCRNMAYPITGTPNRYRCSCGNQFAGPRHPL